MLYVAALLAAGRGPLDDPFEALIRFWIGDAIGILVTLPPILMVSVPARRAEMAAMLGRRETLVHGVAIASALAAVFLAPGGDQVRFFYVLFLPLVFAATRYGMTGSTLSALVIQGAVIANGELSGMREITVIEFQALLIALTVTGLFLGVTVDERRRAEAELRRNMRLAAAGEMAAALAHELNQPLAAAASYARACELIAASSACDRELLSATLAKLVGETTRAAGVVRRLRDFFRTGTTALARVSLGDLAAQVTQSFHSAAQAQGVALETQLPDDAWVMADAVQLQIAVRNLVSNALEAAVLAGGAREVAIRVEREAAGDVRLTVRDSGAGVAARDATRIFEPFETTRTTGMGMGLAIGRAIVEAHGGRLWVEPGNAGVFHLTLPAAGHADE